MNTLKSKNEKVSELRTFNIISSFENDPFVGHLSTPITTSNLTKSYLSNLPAYNSNLSPLLKGINIGLVHGYFLLGPFTSFGPLRNTEASNFFGFLSAISLLIILTVGLLSYGATQFGKKDNEVLWFNSKQWRNFTSGFMVGGFGGSSIAYLLLKFIN